MTKTSRLELTKYLEYLKEREKLRRPTRVLAPQKWSHSLFIDETGEVDNVPIFENYADHFVEFEGTILALVLSFVLKADVRNWFDEDLDDYAYLADWTGDHARYVGLLVEIARRYDICDIAHLLDALALGSNYSPQTEEATHQLMIFLALLCTEELAVWSNATPWFKGLLWSVSLPEFLTSGTAFTENYQSVLSRVFTIVAIEDELEDDDII